jgi:GNAT superfamily N-acetyltransferase
MTQPMTSHSTLVIEPLNNSHDRPGFHCGVASLDDYIRKRARQDVKRRISQVFVATQTKDPSTIVGYYTLSTLSIELKQLPEDLARKLPRHPVPAALLGRLAVSQAAQGHGVGRMLLVDALKRTLAVSEEIGIFALVVDAIEELLLRPQLRRLEELRERMADAGPAEQEALYAETVALKQAMKVRAAEVRSLAAGYLAHVVRSVRTVGYLGWAPYLRHRGLTSLPFVWGWKDPRTTFTLPVWTDVFPEARVIHVLRHGVDVAASLRARHRRALARRAEAFRRRRPIYSVWAKRTGFTDSLRCATLEGGFSLWEEYVDQGRALVQDLGSRALELRYEDLLEDPVGRLRDLAVFCGLAPTHLRLTEAGGAVDARRSLAFRGDPELEAFSEAAADRLRERGY